MIVESTPCSCSRPRATLRAGDLSESQIEWLRLKVPTFDRAWRSVQDSDLWAAKIRAQVGLNDFTAKG